MMHSLAKVHVILGSGTVGTKLAFKLAKSGDEVLLITRSGTGPAISYVRRVKADASSFSSLKNAAPKADFVYNCVNPPYNKWDELWPTINKAVIEFVASNNAILVTCSNLYGYGPHNGILTEDLPLLAKFKNGRVRAEMWLEVNSQHELGKIRATEVRGSDYICASEQSRMGDRVVPRLKNGKAIQLLGALNQPHTWTDPDDVAELMMVAATDKQAWGKPWHVPSNAPKSQLEVIQDIAALLEIAKIKVSQVPATIEKILSLFNPVIRELRETNYQFNNPFVMSDAKARTTFGLKPKPWNSVIKDLVTEYS